MLNKQKDDWGSPMIDLQLKQGYIFLKKKSSWIRRWLVVTDGLLYIYKGWKVPLPFLSFLYSLFIIIYNYLYLY